MSTAAIARVGVSLAMEGRSVTTRENRLAYFDVRDAIELEYYRTVLILRAEFHREQMRMTIERQRRQMEIDTLLWKIERMSKLVREYGGKVEYDGIRVTATFGKRPSSQLLAVLLSIYDKVRINILGA